MSDARATHWLAGTPMDPVGVPTERLPALAGCPFLYEGSCAVIVGPTGRGRSSLVQASLYDAAFAGLDCAYLGSEVTRDEFNARAAMLASRRGHALTDHTRKSLARVRYLDLPSTIATAWTATDDWVQAAASRYQLLAIDPLAAAGAALDLDFDKSNHDFLRFYERLIEPLRDQGLGVILIDNVGHAEDARARAKGASAKQDKPDLTYSCRLSPNGAGLILTAGKVRSVRAPIQRGDEWLFAKDAQRLEARTGDSDNRALQPTSSFRPTSIMQHVSETVETTPGLTRNAIRTALKGTRASYVDLAIQILISEDYLAVTRDGQAHHHTSATPYRAVNDKPTESQPGPNRVPDPVEGTGSHRVPTGHVVPVGSGPGSNGHGPANQVPHEAMR